MTSFYSEDELNEIGFRSYGKNVQISRKASIYNAQKITLGDHVRIDDFCILSGEISIGNYVHIAAYSAIFGGSDGVKICDFANLSPRVTVYSVNDNYTGEAMAGPTIPDEYRKVESEPVLIERHVLVGSTSVILPGVTLKEGSSFGSFSLINHDSEAWSVNIGIPFRKIKDRNQTILELEKKFMQENE